MAKTKKQNSNQVPNGGYTLGGYGAVPPTYSTTMPVTGAGVTYTTATGASTWATNITVDPYYTKTPKVNITDKDLILDGLSLRDFMQTVNERMGIMVPNPKLEAEFNELKELADRYRELEKKMLDQKEMWDLLKKE